MKTDIKKIREILSQLNKEKLARLQSVLEEIENKELRQEIVERFKQAIDIINQRISALESQLTEQIESQQEKSFKDVRMAMNAVYDKLEQVKVMRKGKDGKDGKDGRDGMDGEDADVSEAARIASEMALKQLKSEKMRITTIKGLKRKLEAISGQLEELKKKEPKIVYTGGGGGTGGKIVKAYDLSSQLDGSTKTFKLPSFWRVISVHLSSFPNILRPTVDYTVNYSESSITFTSEIDASTSLSKGQTLIVIYGTK